MEDGFGLRVAREGGEFKGAKDEGETGAEGEGGDDVPKPGAGEAAHRPARGSAEGDFDGFDGFVDSHVAYELRVQPLPTLPKLGEGKT